MILPYVYPISLITLKLPEYSDQMINKNIY